MSFSAAYKDNVQCFVACGIKTLWLYLTGYSPEHALPEWIITPSDGISQQEVSDSPLAPDEIDELTSANDSGESEIIL